LGVLPDTQVQGVPVRVAVKGAYFYAEVRRQLNQPEKFRVNEEFIIRFWPESQQGTDAIILTNVVLRNSTTLEGSVPGTLALGTYTVEVESPMGMTGILGNAFTVIPAGGGALDSETAPDSYADTSPTDGPDTDADLETGGVLPTDSEVASDSYVDGDHSADGLLDDHDDHCIKRYGDGAMECASGSLSGIQHAWAGNYTMEFAIPWTRLGVSPYSGMTIGFDIGVNDDDNFQNYTGRDSQIRWFGTDDDWQDTSKIGTVILHGTTAP
jgi:hypothetical protein